MAIGWFLCPYDILVRDGYVLRMPRIAQFAPVNPNPNGEMWKEVETLKNMCVVKVRSTNARLTALNNQDGFIRLPETISDAVRTIIKNRLLDMGFTLEELRKIQSLRDFLELLASSRSRIVFNDFHDGIVILPERRATGRLQELDEAVVE
jgi:hypothetical protein